MLLQTKIKNTRLHNFFHNPTRIIVSSFAFLILFGAFLLMLPICSRSGEATSFTTALFTATSATCVTGLIVVDTYTHYSTIGQIVIISLIQLGGLGLVTFVTFFNLAIRKKLGLKSLQLAGESISADSFDEVRHLLKMIFRITFSIEFAGALILMTVFVPQYQIKGVFISIFLAISAFCNAGFDVLGFQEQFVSLSNYNSNPVVLITIMSLIVCGGLGFIVWQDLLLYRKTKRLIMHTKIVLFTTIGLILFGALFCAIFEWKNPTTIGTMSVSDKILNSFFLSVTTRTAGFNSTPIDTMYGITKLFCVLLMFIGASPASTGGGIKTTTFLVLVMTIVSVIRGRDETIIHNRKVDKSVVYKALAVTATALVAVFIATATIFFTSHAGGTTFSEIDALFESVSAFATVGLTSGVTALANQPSLYVLIITMFIGRVGPVSLALSLAMSKKKKNTVMPEAKILVG
ncbi:potassium transporter TrkG [Paludicola sp. MB14-C6]|uniref:TrkH family potassium uptake protein n=1 Tax=Paludihabitans sp. MB14-C6 TaxID=3070656 RepID=UPI0027DCBC30|nr:potassium transporter TrkG [Paludicola sp. MB14-C6]WMJ24057.1 potassium transporter TrkG [Paludicola sp. MB14-C6]